jgi:hypothetical protein
LLNDVGTATRFGNGKAASREAANPGEANREKEPVTQSDILRALDVVGFDTCNWGKSALLKAAGKVDERNLDERVAGRASRARGSIVPKLE